MRLLKRLRRQPGPSASRPRPSAPATLTGLANGGGRKTGAMDVRANELEREILALINDEDLESIANHLIELPDRTKVLDALARSHETEARGYLPTLAVKVLGAEAMPLLLRLLRDPDPDNRGLALDAIERLDPGAVEHLLPRLRRSLGSRDDSEVLRTAWVLVRFRDTASVGVIQAWFDAYADQPTAWPRKAASVVLMAMNEPDAVPAAIRGHDHDRMRWLAYAAAIIGSTECLDALSWGSQHLADDACRNVCRHAIETHVLEQRSLRNN